MNKKAKNTFYLALTVFSLMGQIAWVVENMYLNVFIYKTFSASATDISYMVAASAITATLTTVFIGALSDRIGRRKLFICGGYILWGVSIFSFVLLRTDVIGSFIPSTLSAASVGISLTIILDCVMTFFGSSANDAAFNAWLTDSTSDGERGKAEGINAMMPLVAVLVVFGGFMFFDLDRASSWTVIFSIIGALTLLVGVLGIFIIKDPDVKRSETGYFSNIVYGFLPSTVRKNPFLYVVLAAFVIFNVSIQIFMPYLIIYYEVSLGMTDYVLIMAPAIVLASVVTFLWGKLYDKKGFTFSGILSLVMLIIGYAVLFLTRTKLPVFLGSLFMMSGYLAGMAVFGAVIRDNTPTGKAGRLQGVRIFSQVLIPGVVGPFIGKAVLGNAETIVNNDGTSSFVPNANIFLAAAVAAILVFFVFFFVKNKKTVRTVELPTDYENELDENGVPFSEYPRPQMKRSSYVCLNGKWDFSVLRGDETLALGKILVPFVPESRISGIAQTIEKNDVMVYERNFEIGKGDGERVILHFGAVDQLARVFVNGEKVGENTLPYLPFSFDITDFINKDTPNRLRVEAIDTLDTDLPYGKQTEKRGGMWYTKVSGIQQTVWLECVPVCRIEKLRITPDVHGVDIEVEISCGEGEKILCFDGKEYRFSTKSFRLDVDTPHLWTPEDPYLYTFTLKYGDDTVESYFGLRSVSIESQNGKSYICLNGKPYFCHGLLDQGYFSDGIFLPASEKGFADDILRMKDCAFNMLRKHIKLECDLFYYYCDKYGMLVFQDMINSGKYSFFVDTALPTVFMRSGITHRASAYREKVFKETCAGIIDCLYNHPCVVYYTIFNEGWGQFKADELYEYCKGLDATRIYDSTSGWFRAKKSDVESEHIYFKKVKMTQKSRPNVLSEFGGYSCKTEGHSFNLDNTYGYRFFENEKDFEDALVRLYEDEIVPAIENAGLCATVLTQVSDVEDETNGLLTYDRKVLKVNPARMKALGKTLFDAFERKTKC